MCVFLLKGFGWKEGCISRDMQARMKAHERRHTHTHMCQTHIQTHSLRCRFNEPQSVCLHKLPQWAHANKHFDEKLIGNIII